MSIESGMPSNHLILCRPLLLLSSIFPNIRVFSNELALRIRWTKYWSFIISPSNEYSGLISLRIDWLDLLAVQGTLKSLLQHHSSKASILCTQPSLWANSHSFLLGYAMTDEGMIHSEGRVLEDKLHFARLPWPGRTGAP